MTTSCRKRWESLITDSPSEAWLDREWFVSYFFHNFLAIPNSTPNREFENITDGCAVAQAQLVF